MNELHQHILDAQAAQDAKDDVTRQAAKRPLPGNARKIFSITPDIKVGPWTVRPFYDGDFDILESLDHPLLRWMSDKDIESRLKHYKMRGLAAWQLLWLMTTPIGEIEELYDAGTLSEELKVRPLKTFRRIQQPELQELHAAIFDQVSVYWGAASTYGKDAAKEGGDPPSSGQPSTESAG